MERIEDNERAMAVELLGSPLTNEDGGSGLIIETLNGDDGYKQTSMLIREHQVADEKNSDSMLILRQHVKT